MHSAIVIQVLFIILDCVNNFANNSHFTEGSKNHIRIHTEANKHEHALIVFGKISYGVFALTNFFGGRYFKPQSKIEPLLAGIKDTNGLYTCNDHI